MKKVIFLLSVLFLSICTPGLLYISAFNVCSSSVSFPGDEPTQTAALCDLFTSTNGLKWINNNNWGLNTSYCEWYGIYCDYPDTNPWIKIDNSKSKTSIKNNIHRVLLSNNNLVGELPESLGQLIELVELDLSQNTLTGSLPQSIGQAWKLLKLQIQHNKLFSDLSQSLGEMRFLQYLDISNNNIGGNLPDSLSGLRSLEYFNAANNSLQGTIPYTFQFIRSLKYLDFSNNLLQENIPSFFDNMSNLTRIYLGNNLFQSIDNRLTLSHVKTCDFSGNTFYCPIPIKSVIWLNVKRLSMD